MLSVIMPVYNARSYLADTLESVLAQTYRDFELILVDDGSTDGSGELCDTWARKDCRIRVIHKANGGVASARNAGLDAARGDYIGWVDSDDLIAPFMFETMLSVAEQYDADIVQCSHVRFADKLAREPKPENLEVLGPIDSLKRIYRSHYTNSLALWSKIYRAEVFKGLRFTEGTAFEDDELVPRLLHRGRKNVFFDLPMYCYVKRQSSIITAPSEKNILALTRHMEERMLWCRELDHELYIMARDSFYYYLKRKAWETAFVGTQVQENAIANLKKYRSVFWRQANRYDKIAMVLLTLPGGKGWVVRTEFEPIQSLIRKIRGNE